MGELGVELIPVRASLKGIGRTTARRRMGAAEIAASDPIAIAIGLAASAALRRLRDLDGVLRIGSGFELATRLPTVTFDDMTVAQALAQPGSEYAALSPAAARRWMARQARALRSARACCFTSRWAADSALADFSLPATKARVVGLGCDFPQLPGGRDWSTPRFLFVGFDWERKRGADVVNSFAAIRSEHPDAHLDLVGGHPPIDAHGVTGHGPLSLSSPAERERLLDLFRQATCFVMPSRFEPYGIAYVEAGRAGIASIGTTVGGATDAIGQGGILVDPDRPAELIEAMRRLAGADEARRLGRLATAHAAELSRPAVAAKVLTAFAPPPA
jgi:Glycosyl transferases group 1